MTKDDRKGVMSHMRKTIMRGVLFMVPIAVTVFVVSLIAGLSASWLGAPVAWLMSWLLPEAWLVGRLGSILVGLGSLILLIALLYVVGGIAGWPVGSRGLRLIDHVFQAIPGVRIIYSAARKVVDAVGDTKQTTFQRAVLINWGHGGTKTIGFVTNETVDRTSGGKVLVVFIPTPPNPASGFITWVPAKEAVDPGISMEQALKIAMSLGVLTPPRMTVTRPLPPACGTTDPGFAERTS